MVETVACTGAGLIIPSGTGIAALRLFVPQFSGTARLITNVPAIEGIARNDVRRMSKLTRYTIFAAHQAMAASACPKDKTGLFVGCTHGSTSLLTEFHDYLFDYGPDMASPNTFSNGVTNAPLSSASAFLKVTGGGTTFLGYENAGSEMLNYCADSIADADYEACCIGASEEFSDIVNGAYGQCGWYSVMPPPYLPFPMDHGDGKTGFGVGEGSAFIVQESLDRIAGRGAKPLCYYTSVDIEEDTLDVDVVVSGAGAGPQDSYELDMLKLLGKRSRGKKPALVFSKPLFGESFALGSALSNCMAIDMVANAAHYPSFTLHPEINGYFSTEMTTAAQKVLVVSCARNGQVSAGLFWRDKGPNF
jgi:3-oxoacyl-(acyl-carrier-protein) synthase